MDKTISIINTCNKEKEKILIFSSVYYLWTQIESICHDNSLRRTIFRQFNTALKNCINRYNDVDYIDYRRVLKEFILLFYRFSKPKETNIKYVLDKYLYEIEHINWHYPYVDNINKKDCCFEQKAILLMDTQDYLKNIFNTLSLFDASNEVIVKLIYNISDVLKDEECNASNVYNMLSEKAFKILEELSLEGSFNPFACKNSDMINSIDKLTTLELNSWKKYQLFLIVGLDDLRKVMVTKEELAALKRARSKLLGFEHITKTL